MFSSGVCAFRLDFESFSIAALGNSEEAILAAVGPPAITAAPAVCRDTMTATVSTHINMHSPETIC